MKGYLAAFGVFLGVMAAIGYIVDPERNAQADLEWDEPDGWIEPPPSVPTTAQSGDLVMSRGDFGRTPTPVPTRTPRPTMTPTPEPIPEFSPEFVELVDRLWEPKSHVDEGAQASVDEFIRDCVGIGLWDTNKFERLNPTVNAIRSVDRGHGSAMPWLQGSGEYVNLALNDGKLPKHMSDIGFSLACVEFVRGEDVTQIDTYSVVIFTDKIDKVTASEAIWISLDGETFAFDRLAEIPAVQVYPRYSDVDFKPYHKTYWAVGYTPKELD